MGFLRIFRLIPSMSCVSQFWHAWVFRTFAGLQTFISKFHFHHLGPGAFPGTSSCLSQRMKFDSGLVFRFGFPGYVFVRAAATGTSGWNLAKGSLGDSWFLVWPVLLCFVCASGFMLFHSVSQWKWSMFPYPYLQLTWCILLLQMSLKFILDVPRHAEMSIDIRIIAFGNIVL